MSLAASMKDLVEDIRFSTEDRHAFVKNVTKDVKELIARFDKELEEMAKDLKHFLANSEKSRKEDFVVMMKDIAVRLEDISKWQKDVRKGARELVKEYGVESKKAKEIWLSLSGHKKSGHVSKKEESGENNK